MYYNIKKERIPCKAQTAEYSLSDRHLLRFLSDDLIIHDNFANSDLFIIPFNNNSYFFEFFDIRKTVTMACSLVIVYSAP